MVQATGWAEGGRRRVWRCMSLAAGCRGALEEQGGVVVDAMMARGKIDEWAKKTHCEWRVGAKSWAAGGVPGDRDSTIRRACFCDADPHLYSNIRRALAAEVERTEVE